MAAVAVRGQVLRPAPLNQCSVVSVRGLVDTCIALATAAAGLAEPCVFAVALTDGVALRDAPEGRTFEVAPMREAATLGKPAINWIGRCRASR